MLEQLSELAGRGPTFGFLAALVLAYAVVHVLTRNALLFQDDAGELKLDDDERLVDQVQLAWFLGRNRFTLTNRRIVLDRFSWFFSAQRRKTIPLADLHSATFWSLLNPVLLVLAFWLLTLSAPLALIVAMAALESSIGHVGLRPAASRSLFGRLGLWTFTRRSHAAAARFYRNASASLAAAKGQPTGALTSDGFRTFAWGKALWLAVLGLMAIAVVHRLTSGIISFDDVIFAPLYLGIPVGLARRGVREAAWAALLGFAAVVSVKFPVGPNVAAQLGLDLTGLGQGSFFAAQGWLVLAGLFGTCVLAGAIARATRPALAPLALLLWPAVVAMDSVEAALDTRVAAITLLAMAVAYLVPPRSSAATAPALEAASDAA